MPVSDQEFSEYMAARWRGLYRSALVLARDQRNAEELAQAALVRVYVARRRISDPARLDAYTQRALINVFYAEHRRSTRWLHHTLDVGAHEVAEGDHATATTEQEHLIGLVRQLPRQQRAAIILRYLLDVSVSEAADRMGCTEGSVKTHTSRGLARLQELALSTSAEINR